MDMYRRLCGVLCLASSLLAPISRAQLSPNCPILGPVFPAPVNVLQESTVVPEALRTFQHALEKAIDEDTELWSNSTSFYLSVFSRDSQLINYAYEAPNIGDALTSGTLDKDTLFRIASVSKLVTIYAALVEVGLERMNDPITKWVPELSLVPNRNSDTIVQVKWEEITLGALASHMAGITRDVSLFDSAVGVNKTIAELVALPLLPDEEIPTCGTDSRLPGPCSREEFFSVLQNLYPVTPSFHTPIYSNVAFQVLEYALEAMANKPFNEIVQSSVLDPLGMNRTFLQPPQSPENAIIPESEESSWWDVETGGGTAFGGMFSTPSDLTALGRSILISELLSAPETRRWLKPVSHTSDLQVSVGMPWEIRRALIPISPSPSPSRSRSRTTTTTTTSTTTSKNLRISDLYTKNGNLGAWTTLLGLSPDHGLGFALLLSSPTALASQRFAAMGTIGDLFADMLVPAFEAAAREQAAVNFGGVYASEEKEEEAEMVMSLTIAVEDGRPGLGVYNWTTADGKDVLYLYSGIAKPSLRLYPMTGVSSGAGKVLFRGVYEEEEDDLGGATTNGCSSSESGKIFSGGCLSWGGVGSPTYGNVGFDEFVIAVDGRGRAVSVTPRVSRQTLSRVQ